MAFYSGTGQTSVPTPTAQVQPPKQYTPFGGDVFGYNANRLARLMDPSATLPGDQITAPPPVQAAAPAYIPTLQDFGFGGKGGGYYEPQPMFMPPPQYQQYPYPPMYPPAYAQPQPAPVQNPFIPAPATQRPPVTTQPIIRDTGEIFDKQENIYNLPKPYEEFSVGYTPEERQRDEQAKLPTSEYKFTKRVRYTPEELQGLKKKDIASLYSDDLKKQKADVAELEKRLKAATTPQEKKEVRAKLDANIKSVKSLERDIAKYTPAKTTTGTNVDKAITSGGGYNPFAFGVGTAGAAAVPTKKEETKKKVPALAETRKKNR